MLHKLKITIVGAGIAGLTTALALKQKGFSNLVVFERSQALTKVGAGLQLGPNAVRELVRLGVGEQLSSVSNNCPVGDIHSGESSKSTYLGELPLSRHSLRAYGQPCYQLLRSDLQKILHEAVRKEGIEIRFNHSAMSIEFDAESANILFEDGTHHKSELVVVADGIKSSISKQLFPKQPLTYSGFACWRGLIEREDLGDAWVDQVRIFTGEDRHMVVYPIANSTKLNLVATTKYPDWPVAENVMHLPKEKWLESYSGWSKQVLDLISCVNKPQLWALFERESLPAWHHRRAIVIGDAAHPMLPSLAQGAAQAIEDGVSLAAVLSGSPSLASSEEVLDGLLGQHFENRSNRVKRVQNASRWNLNYFHAPAGIGRTLRNSAMRGAGPIASKVISSKYNWLYAERGYES